MRSDIRNPWAHCDFTEWTTTKYTDSFDLMGKLVKDLGLSNQDENRNLGDLNTWGTNGHHFLSGTVLGLEIVEKIRKKTHILSEYVQTLLTETDNQFSRAHTELKDLENGLLERIRNLENTTMKHGLTLKCVEAEMKRKDEDHIPNHIRVKHGQEIGEWEEDQATFVQTRATRHLLESLSLKNCIIVTGSSGCGKSSIIHHAALQLRDRFGYEIIPALTFPPRPKDIINYHKKNKKQVFVVDDICGKETINTHTLQIWRDSSEKMGKIFSIAETEVANNSDDTVSKVSGPKLLISCRLHIFKESQFQRVPLLTDNECNLLSPKLCLLQEERMCMLRKYLPDDTICNLNEQQFIENVDFFPLVCKIAKGKKTEDVKKLFEAPLNSIKLNLQNIIDANKNQFCALALCILFDDGFNTDWLELGLSSVEEQYIVDGFNIDWLELGPSSVERKNKIEKIVDEFDIKLDKEMHINSLKSGFFTLDGTYLKQRGTEYRFIHDKIFKLAAVICGQEITQCFIKYAPSVFIRDNFIFKSVKEVQETDGLIALKRVQEREYFERLLCDLKARVVTSTFHNKQLIYESYMDKFITFLEKNDHAKTILTEFDLEGYKRHNYNTQPTSLFVESVSSGYVPIVRFLIAYIKCNVNNANNKGRSPLYKACKKGHFKIVELLLENDANINHLDYLKNSPLDMACAYGHKDIVTLLLHSGAAVFKCGDEVGYQNTQLDCACREGYTDIVELLLQYKTDVSHFDCYDDESPLDFACSWGNTEIVKLLLEHNADANQSSCFRNYPLDAACEWGYTEIVELLLKHNADVFQWNQKGVPPLNVACYRSAYDIVKLLLQTNAAVISRYDNDGHSALHIACQKGRTDIVKLLLQYNANVSQCNSRGESPLYEACDMDHYGHLPRDKYQKLYSNHIETVKLLLAGGADVKICDNKGLTPLDIARNSQSMEIINLLEENTQLRASSTEQNSLGI